MDEAVRGYDDMLREIDEDGGIAVIDEFAQGLSQCLKNNKADAQTRRAWLETLLEAELADIEMGGIDLAPSARETILEHANDEEWSWIEERFNDAMLKSGGWEREALARFLAAGQKRNGQAAKRKKPGVAKYYNRRCKLKPFTAMFSRRSERLWLKHRRRSRRRGRRKATISSTRSTCPSWTGR
jgi:hypothetical protein